MPRRTQYQKQRYGRRVTTMSNVLSTANLALKTAKIVKSLINTEFFWADTKSSLSPSTAGAVLQLTNIAQGDGVSNRHGESIKLKSLKANFTITQNASGDNTMVRIIYFIDQDGTTPPTVSNLLDDVNMVGLRNMNYKSRFIILKDMVINLGDNTCADGKYYKKLNHQVTWHGTAGTSALKGHLWVAYISTEATNTPTLIINHRVRYLDN